MVTANGPDDGVCSWRAMQDGAHFIELVTKPPGGRRSVLLQSDGEGTDEEQAMAHVVRAVNSYGASKPLLDAAARLAEAVDRHRRAETPLHVPLGKVRRATSEEIEQTGAVVDAVLAVYRHARAKAVDSHVSDAPLDPVDLDVLAAVPRATMKA